MYGDPCSSSGFGFSRFDPQEHEERTSKLQDTTLLKHRLHLLERGPDLGHIALIRLPWYHLRLEHAEAHSHLEGDSQYNLVSRP